MGYKFNPFTGKLDAVGTSSSGIADLTGSENTVGSYNDGFYGDPEVCARIRDGYGNLAWAKLNAIAWNGYTPTPFANQSLNTGDTATFGQLTIFDQNASVAIFQIIASTDDGEGSTTPAEIQITPTITSPLTVSGTTNLSTLSTSGTATVASLSVTGTSTFTGSPTFNSVVTANQGIKTNSFAVTSPSVPASATASGVKGQISYDSNYFYVCVATNTWKRTALSTW
jgi:hypothetical protein